MKPTQKSAPAFQGSLPSGESDPSVTLDRAGADTVLLPCPFCGAPARDDLLPHAGGPGWVQCSACECDQHMSDTLEEAVARWNTRSTPASVSTPAQDAISKADQALRHADIDLSFAIPMIADNDQRVAIQRTRQLIDNARAALAALQEKTP